jgi:alpha-L-fucosidase
MNRYRSIAGAGLLLISAAACVSAGETAQQRDARLAWWREARFGLFVHWGLYSGLAGTWDGKPLGTSGGMEWIQQRVSADTETYAARAVPLFKPGPVSRRNGRGSRVRQGAGTGFYFKAP